MFGYFFHGIFRKIVIGFGTLFNDVYVKKYDRSGNVTSSLKVPIQYGPYQKFLARIEQAPDDLNNPQQITLPIMSYEFNGISYNNEDKLPATRKFCSTLVADGKTVTSNFMPVPYIMNFQLHIMAKHSEDIWQITEQILPYFHPSYTITINLLKEIGEKKDIPITFKTIEMQDDYEGNYESRRSIIYTLNFEVKTYLFGPTKETTDSLIKKVAIGYVAGATDDDPEAARRDITYEATAEAVDTYSDTLVGNLTKDLSFTGTILYLTSISGLEVDSKITVDDESMKVTYINESDLSITVERATYNTANSIHVKGSRVEVVVEADNDLIRPGDEFEINDNIIGFID